MSWSYTLGSMNVYRLHFGSDAVDDGNWIHFVFVFWLAFTKSSCRTSSTAESEIVFLASAWFFFSSVIATETKTGVKPAHAVVGLV